MKEDKFDIDFSDEEKNVKELETIFEEDFCFPDQAVFIKEDKYEGKIFWGIYDIEGTRIAVTDNRDCAFVIARQNDFIPNSVH